jgi:hypothetical protein
MLEQSRLEDQPQSHDVFIRIHETPVLAKYSGFRRSVTASANCRAGPIRLQPQILRPLLRNPARREHYPPVR